MRFARFKRSSLNEQVRYAVDTGSAPPRPRPGLLGRARYVLIPLGAVGMLAASTYALQATRGPAHTAVCASEAATELVRGAPDVSEHAYVLCRSASRMQQPGRGARHLLAPC